MEAGVISYDASIILYVSGFLRRYFSLSIADYEL